MEVEELLIFFLQVDALLHSLDIDNDVQIKGPLPGRELEEYWNESQSIQAAVADRWVTEFRPQQPEPFPINGWVNSFEQEHGRNGWASEFEHVRTKKRSLKWHSFFFFFLLLSEVLGAQVGFVIGC